MSVKSLRLITGEDIIADAILEDGIWTLKNPVRVSMVPNGGPQPTFGFMPFPLTSNDKEIPIDEKYIVFVCEPAEEFLNQYNSLFGTGIITPTKKLLV